MTGSEDRRRDSKGIFRHRPHFRDPLATWAYPRRLTDTGRCQQDPVGGPLRLSALALIDWLQSGRASNCGKWQIGLRERRRKKPMDLRPGARKPEHWTPGD